jgi:elongation factor 1-beta
MAVVIVTLKVMPTSPDENLEAIQVAATKEISKFGGNVGKVTFEPIAFGLKAVMLMFAMDESIGGTEDLEAKIVKIAGVESAQVTDVRRAIG